jgi:hypothetical protein
VQPEAVAVMATAVPTDAGDAGADGTAAEEQALDANTYWLEVYASQRPRALPDAPGLVESRTQTETTYVPRAAPLVFHWSVGLDE